MLTIKYFNQPRPTAAVGSRTSVSEVSPDDVARVGAALRQFSLAANRLRTTVAALLPINVTELIALGQLAECAERTPTQLAQDLNISTATVTVLVDHLEAAGFVFRTRSTVDRRSLTLSLTAAGTRIMQQLQERYRAAIAEAFEQSGATLAPEIAAFLEQASRTLATFTLTELEPESDPSRMSQQQNPSDRLL